jgi:hypothetical protein
LYGNRDIEIVGAHFKTTIADVERFSTMNRIKIDPRNRLNTDKLTD